MSLMFCTYCEKRIAPDEKAKRGNYHRECLNERTRMYRELRKTEGRPYYAGKKSKRTRKQHLAQEMVNRAVRLGILKPPKKCQRCKGGPEPFSRLDSHHADYNKPLEVKWLCRTCHVREHDSGREPLNKDTPITPGMFLLPSRSKSDSGYFGVSGCFKKWRAVIWANDKEIPIGIFASKEEAARARDAEVIKRGLNCRLNFNPLPHQHQEAQVAA